MKPILRVTLVQDAPIWEKPEPNLVRLEKLIRSGSSADLIVLPEMFNSGFSMRPALFARESADRTLEWMKRLSLETGAALCGSIALPVDENRFANRLFLVRDGNIVLTYDKRHGFSLAGEQEVYQSGHQSAFYDLDGWNVSFFICYDLRFPAWCRQTDAKGRPADLMVFPANWPSRRIDAWSSLLKARAIENLCFVAGVNRVGIDGNQVEHEGRSAILDYAGKTMVTLSENPGLLHAQIDFSAMERFRQAMRFLDDRDNFSVHI